MHLLIIDNYDSFTYNLAHLFESCGVRVTVRRNNTSLEELVSLEADALCISPGPGTPADSGVSFDALRHWEKQIPILGVCLGMQVINEFYGGLTVHAPLPIHGKTDIVEHTAVGLFAGIGGPFKAARYHSLVIERNSDELDETAWSGDGCVMAVAHISLPITGVQFHPESFLTEHGATMARNFLDLGGAA